MINENLLNVTNFDSLQDIQNYCRSFISRKEFKNESPVELMLLLQEEIGELAGNIRKCSGIKTSLAKSNMNIGSLGFEISDCIKYLVIIANKYNINLSESFKHKQVIDEERTWHTME
jgi:NTP pyrophosphatase (non-canonical NTP hydrolase)